LRVKKNACVAILLKYSRQLDHLTHAVKVNLFLGVLFAGFSNEDKPAVVPTNRLSMILYSVALTN
jgi:hypothetical protein